MCFCFLSLTGSSPEDFPCGFKAVGVGHGDTEEEMMLATAGSERA